MPIITSIKPQKSKKRVNIYLDDKFGFGLDLENFVGLGLKVEQELSEKEVTEIVKKAEFQKVYDRLLIFCSLRPRSKKEVNLWFKKHQVPISLHEELLSRLTSLELLDDKKFSAWWISQRLAFKNKSKRVLSLELSQKGVAKEIIDEVIAEADIDELTAAKKLLEKKSRLFLKYDEFTARRKRAEYLLKNGFSWSLVREILNSPE